VRSVQTGPVIALIAELSLLGGLAVTVGLTGFGWVVGVGYVLIMNVLLVRALNRAGARRLESANRVTLARGTLVGGVAALVADSFVRPAPVSTLVVLTIVALVLDAVDGWLARRTGTMSRLGARFDMEVDAFLIAVLSVYVAHSTGAWVLAIGAARYVFVAVGWLLPWLQAPLPPRYWRKVVAGTVAVLLTVAAADVLPRTLMAAALGASLVLLTESFGRDVWWLWRHHRAEPGPSPVRHLAEHGPRLRTAAASLATVLAFLLVWLALVAPTEISRLTIGAFIRIPVEGLAFVALVVVLPGRASRIVAGVLGFGLGLLTLLKIINMGFFATLDRPFNPLTDWAYLGHAEGLLGDSIGRDAAIASVVVGAVLGLALLVIMTLSVLRLARFASRHHSRAIGAVTALGVVWIAFAVSGALLVPGAPIASSSAAGLAYDQVRDIFSGLQDRKALTKAIADDPWGDIAGDDLLTRLRGKDVVIAFVESYGRVAVQDSTFSPQVDALLDAGTQRLRAAGFSSRSAFLTSPTFGGISWLAHSTLQSGLWIDNQGSYNQLVESNRFTLSSAFARAGWRTVGDVPSNQWDWPEGASFYHYDTIYDSRNVGYRGPSFSYASMPDQYVLSAFQQLELAQPDHAPVMAEIDLVSSHTPWAPLPRMVAWSKVGDGSVFDGMPSQGESPDVVWRDANQVKAAYAQSIKYSLRALISFVQKYADNNLVLILVGDHQPATIVTGEGASHDVPVTIIAHDTAVLDRISSWGWQDGMRPGADAPVWPMDAFRDRFLSAFGPKRVNLPGVEYFVAR